MSGKLGGEGIREKEREREREKGVVEMARKKRKHPRMIAVFVPDDVRVFR